MDIPQKALELNSIPEFNLMQRKALDADLFRKSVVISAPTASGKTLVAEMASLHAIINNSKKVLFTCPLRALASEHYSGFKKKYSSSLNIRAAISTGDFDSGSKHLTNYDIIFLTNEKLDSLLRHRSEWLTSVGLLVVDEIHELDSGRGPTLEMVIAKMRSINPNLQTLALSATIPNAKDLARWLDANLVESDYRPVALLEGTHFNSRIKFPEKQVSIPQRNTPIDDLAIDTFEQGKQCLVFANTRKRAEGIAKQLSPQTPTYLNEKEKIKLKTASEQILHALESPTEQCKSLSQLIEKGVCFHHAGLMQKQREIIEELFRENQIKALAATPTLTAGVNLPAFRIIIPTLFRYGAYGMERITVREYKQLCGRAGRPKYHDTEGQAVIIAKSDIDEDELQDYYINGELEEITSKMGAESVLRTHLLAIIATGFAYDLESLEKFFSRTFYAYQYGELSSLFEKITEILTELEEMGFVKSDEKRIAATPLGNRVSELYLDPYSAKAMIDALQTGKNQPLSYLFALTNTSEAMPWIRVPKAREPGVWETVQSLAPELPIDVQREQFTDMHLLPKFQTSQMLHDWLNETSEQTIMREYKTMPGILHAKLQRADWLAYAMYELARLLSMQPHLAELAKLRKRLKYGVREELLILTELRNIGRVRARRLWNANLRTIAEIKRTDVKDLGRIIGPKVAEGMKQQLKA